MFCSCSCLGSLCRSICQVLTCNSECASGKKIYIVGNPEENSHFDGILTGGSQNLMDAITKVDAQRIHLDSICRTEQVAKPKKENPRIRMGILGTSCRLIQKLNGPDAEKQNQLRLAFSFSGIDFESKFNKQEPITTEEVKLVEQEIEKIKQQAQVNLPPRNSRYPRLSIAISTENNQTDVTASIPFTPKRMHRRRVQSLPSIERQEIQIPIYEHPSNPKVIMNSTAV